MYVCIYELNLCKPLNLLIITNQFCVAKGTDERFQSRIQALPNLREQHSQESYLQLMSQEALLEILAWRQGRDGES